MKVSRDLDTPRDFSLGSGRTITAKPGEDLFYNRATGQYEVRSAVGGGRSAGRGGATAEELRDYEEKGSTTERKIKPTKKAKGGMTNAYAKGGKVRGAGIARQGVRQCKVR